MARPQAFTGAWVAARLRSFTPLAGLHNLNRAQSCRAQHSWTRSLNLITFVLKEDIMVRRTTKSGAVWHEPPYTWEEEQELYRGMVLQPGATILHAPRPASPSEPSPGSPFPEPAE